MVLKGLGLALALALLAGCGGGGGSSSGVDNGSEVAAFKGTVRAPGGQLAYRPASPLEWLAGLLVSPAHADMGGVSPVAGIQIELIRVDNNGNPVGAPIATATTSATGTYVLTLPAGMRLAPAANLVIRAVGLTQELRA